MTIIHKFTTYIYGFNDNSISDIESAREIISSTRWDYCIFPYHEQTIEIDDIDDNHKLNNNNLKKETWEKYMDKELKILFDNKIKADKELESYRKKKGLI